MAECGKIHASPRQVGYEVLVNEKGDKHPVRYWKCENCGATWESR